MDRIAVLYTCDNAYLPLTAISIASVIENNRDSEICFYIASEDENHENYRKILDYYSDNKKISFKYLNCKMYDDLLEKSGLDKWGSNSYYVYWKLFAYDFIEEDKIWYLDSDVICTSTIDYPLIDKAIGAVLDSAHASFNKVAGIDSSYYFYNTGSLFVDINKWKQNKCIDKVLNYLNNMKQMPLMCDQDILAIALQDDIEVINPKYNYFSGYDYYGVANSFKMYSLDQKPFYQIQEIEEARKNVMFYHCLGGVFGRPWQEGNHSPIKEDFEKYRNLSVWPDYKTAGGKSLLFKIESFLEFLPDAIYNRVHNLAMRLYLQVQKNTLNRKKK